MKNHQKGFTLIELIVVIAILAILAMILVPSLIGYKKESERGIAVANARTCYITSIYAKGIDSENCPKTILVSSSILAPSSIA